MATDVQSVTSEGTLARQSKTFGLFSMVLFSVSAILVADTVASSAAMGVQGLGFWIILGLLFIPYGFVTAELGSAWPDEGGIYVWVKDQPRPFVVPGGAAGAWISTILCEAGIILTLFLFFYFPVEGTSKTVFWAITVGGTAVSILIGWWLYWHASRSGPKVARVAKEY